MYEEGANVMIYCSYVLGSYAHEYIAKLIYEFRKEDKLGELSSRFALAPIKST